MVDAPERIWIEHGDECPYFYEKDELHEVGSAVTEYVRYSDYAALEAQLAARTDAVKAALSGDTNELIDRMAAAIREDGGHYDDAPWDSLSDERKEGWRGDARRALAVVKEYLTARLPEPASRTVTEAGHE